jgi:pyruvate formate-lyase activating enzyme-like uncharacterized protein
MLLRLLVELATIWDSVLSRFVNVAELNLTEPQGHALTGALTTILLEGATLIAKFFAVFNLIA